MEDQKIKLFLTFNGNAEQAMNYYVTTFPNSEIVELSTYGNDHPYATIGEENKVLIGVISIANQQLLFLDMTDAYPAPAFNYAISLLYQCADETEFDLVFSKLASDGSVMMGPEAVAGFRKCAWVTDKYGVTWQPVWE